MNAYNSVGLNLEKKARDLFFSRRSSSHHRRLLLGEGGRRMHVGVLARVQAERAVVDASQLPKEEEQEARAGEDVEDAVPDHLRARADDVRAFRQSPADRVGEEHEGEVGRGEDVAAAQDAAGCERAARGLPQQNEPVRLM